MSTIFGSCLLACYATLVQAYLLPAASEDSQHLQSQEPESGGLITKEDLKLLASDGSIGVAIISHKRPHYLQNVMDSIFRAARDPQKFPIVISQDGDDADMTEFIVLEYKNKGLAYHMYHQQAPMSEALAIAGKNENVGYVFCAQHFGFAMQQMFDEFRFKQVIFIEEDVKVAPDFFNYFGAMSNILATDPDLYCVSAWNDNGKASLVEDPHVAYRTDFFGGLGWMMDHSLWDELRNNWARNFWDDYLRQPYIRHGRQCIRPEVSRSFTIGKEEGLSHGQFYDDYLSKIKLNHEDIDWTKKDLTYLKSKGDFDEFLRNAISAATPVDQEDLKDITEPSVKGKSFSIKYAGTSNFQAVASIFGLMKDERAPGVFRMSYRGVVPFRWLGNSVFLHTSEFP